MLKRNDDQGVVLDDNMKSSCREMMTSGTMLRNKKLRYYNDRSNVTHRIRCGRMKRQSSSVAHIHAFAVQLGLPPPWGHSSAW